MNTYEGQMIVKDKKYAIVVSRFNDFITSKLLDGAVSTLKRHNCNDSDIDVYWVPGAFEIPFLSQQLAKTKKYNALITLGAVIRGSTPHFDYVCSEVAKGVSRVSLDYNVPVAFGVITTENIEQAIERAGSKAGNKGSEAALVAIEMADLASKFATSSFL